MTPDEQARARDALGAVIQAIESGGLAGDDAQLAHLRGVLAGLTAASPG